MIANQASDVCFDVQDISASGAAFGAPQVTWLNCSESTKTAWRFWGLF